jgi:hypothetical protein
LLTAHVQIPEGLEVVELRSGLLTHDYYPSKGAGERAAWFRDSEGNMLGMGQPTR